jgi:hypothetical protein
MGEEIGIIVEEKEKKRDSENGATRSDPEKVEGRQARLGESIDFWR